MTFNKFDIINSTITKNTVNKKGGGIWCMADLSIKNSLIQGNKAKKGGGIYNCYATYGRGNVILDDFSRIIGNTPNNYIDGPEN